MVSKICRTYLPENDFNLILWESKSLFNESEIIEYDSKSRELEGKYNMKKFTLGIAIVVYILFFATLPIKAQPSLDNSFAGIGYKLTKINPVRDDIARTVLVQPNGRILTGGNSFDLIGYSNIAIVRMKTNGTYDNTFGVAGIASIPNGFFCDMALLPNGKIIVAGSGVGPTNVNNYIVYRLNKNGTLDNSFGTGGSVEINIPYTGMICYDVAIQSDGKIVLGGYSGGSGGYGNMLVVRLKPNGSLDNTFATAGKFTLLLSGKHSECHQLVIQPDGKIVAGGYIDTLIMYAFFRYDFAAVRLNTNGTLDNTFGIAGVVRADKGNTDESYATALLSDGRIILAGFSNYYVNNRFAALCIMPNGSIDPAFGTDGWLFLDFYGGSAIGQAIAVEADDDIILGGYSSLWTDGILNYSIALAKFSSYGIPDLTFGVSGIDTSFQSNIYKACNDIVLQPDGKIIVGGYQYIDANGAYLTARYLNSVAFMRNENVVENSDFLVYPNPVMGQSINVNFKIQQPGKIILTIYNLNGKIVFEKIQYFENSTQNTLEVQLPENLSSGIYIVELNDGKTNQTQKIHIIK